MRTYDVFTVPMPYLCRTYEYLCVPMAQFLGVPMPYLCRTYAVPMRTYGVSMRYIYGTHKTTKFASPDFEKARLNAYTNEKQEWRGVGI
jgi:hypothetical protein